RDVVLHRGYAAPGADRGKVVGGGWSGGLPGQRASYVGAVVTRGPAGQLEVEVVSAVGERDADLGLAVVADREGFEQGDVAQRDEPAAAVTDRPGGCDDGGQVARPWHHGAARHPVLVEDPVG